jgi:PAS domain S-box-containing protein
VSDPLGNVARQPSLDEPARLSALQRSALLDTPVEERFDRITRLASAVLGVPVALVSLVDDHRQFFKSQHGLQEPWASRRETPLSHSLCQHVVMRAEPLVISDAREHPLVRDSLAISELGVVAYAGIPIQSSDGHVLGSFCAIDTKPHEWTESEVDTLRQLGELLRTELQLRDALWDADRAARESAIAASERAAVVASSSDGIYTVGTDGRCTMVNPAASAILGFAPDEVLGRNMHELVHDHYADGTPFPEADCPLYHAFREGRSARVHDTVLWRRDGTPVAADCTSSPLLIAGTVAGAVVTFRDVTNQRRTEHAIQLLADAGEMLASSLEHELTVRAAMRMALPLLGEACVVYLRDEAGSHKSICRHIDSAQEALMCEAFGDAVIALRMPVEGDASVIEAAPAYLVELGMVSVVTAPLRGKQGRIGTLLFASGKRDYDAADLWLAEEIARRVSSAVENATLYSEAQAATSARDEVLAVVSHDLRNPVHTIQMSASFLLEVLGEQPTVDPVLLTKQIGAIRRSALRADRLIRDLMDVTRAERGRLDIDRKAVIVSALLRDASQGIASQADQRGVSVDVEQVDASVRVTGDRDRLLQALDNLLSNAVKFTPMGGLVTLRATTDEQDVCIAVRDTGSGMTTEQQANIFTQFWQARRGDRRGVGLGLTIVKGIVDAHGGTITLESEVGRGSTFQIRMPRATSDNGAVREEGMMMSAS